MSCLQSVSHLVPRVSVVSETLQKYVLPHLAAILCTSLAVPAATPKVQMMCTHTIKCIQLAHWMPWTSSRSYSRLCNPISTACFAAAHSRNPTMWSIYAGGIPRRNTCNTFSLFPSILTLHPFLTETMCVYILNTSPMSYVKLSYTNKWYVRLVLLQPVKKKRQIFHRFRSESLANRDPDQLFDVCLDGMVILSAESCAPTTLWWEKIMVRAKRRDGDKTMWI